MIQTVIFDMDGVIVDTEPIHHFAFREHFKILNIEVSSEMYASFTGNSTKNVYQKLKEFFNLHHEIDDLVETKRAIFNNAFDLKEDLQLLDGVEQLIHDLHQNGMQLILASSSSKVTIDRVFNRFNLHPYFTDIVSGEDFEYSKPHPAIFEYAASLSKGLKDNCIVIEDSTNGIQATKSAEIYCIGYQSEHSKLQDYAMADLVISHFKELNFDFIQNIKT